MNLSLKYCKGFRITAVKEKETHTRQIALQESCSETDVLGQDSRDPKMYPRYFSLIIAYC